jgi:hypothetical protein
MSREWETSGRGEIAWWIYGPTIRGNYMKNDEKKKTQKEK